MMISLNQIANSSYRDPAGFVFYEDGLLFRKVNACGVSDYNHFMTSGLYQELVNKCLIVPHDEIKRSDVDIIIKPEFIEYISYPYEWCFSQYKDAALLTLEIQKISLEYGMVLKDASAYNVQFHKGRPVFIDTLSFTKIQEGEPWAAYKQFCQHFLGPLALMSFTDVRLQKMMTTYIDGLPLELIAGLLPFKTKLNLGLYLHLHLHAKFQNKYAGSTRGNKKVNMTVFQIKALVDNLQSCINKIKHHEIESEWAEYYTFTNYEKNSFEHKKSLLAHHLECIKPKTLIDLGGNDGCMARIATRMNIYSIVCDIDPMAVEKNYQLSRKLNDRYMLPLIQDLVNPSPYIGWHHGERDSFASRMKVDCVLALALVHHLAISNNLPLYKIAQYFSVLADYLIVEFVPKSDTKVQQLLTTRKDIFPDYTEACFEAEFSKIYRIEYKESIIDSERILYVMKKIS